VTALLTAGEAKVPSGEVFHVAGEGAFTWEQVGDALGEALGAHPTPVRIPVPILLALATGADAWAWFTGRPGYFSRGKVREAAGHWLCEMGRARRQLGIVPSVGLTRGAAVTVKWYRDTGTSAAGFSTRLRSSLGCRRRPLPRSRLLVCYAMQRGDGEVI
jgi:nucleoside-diphosphate-sugar epimerase